MPRSKRITAAAVIPARGGSKGIPRKNLVPLLGKPLLLWTIEAAQASKILGAVLVSTEDDEIASVASSAGAEVIERPAHLATDEAPTDPVVVHAIRNSGYEPELAVLLQPTSPLRPRRLIDNCINQLRSSGAKSLFTGCRSHHFVWHRAPGWADDPLHRQSLMQPMTFTMESRKRRQDLSPDEVPILENGNVYVTVTEDLMRGGNRIVRPTECYEMPEVFSIDINHESELAHAELLMRAFHSAESARLSEYPLEAAC